jgi:hypothetical protein
MNWHYRCPLCKTWRYVKWEVVGSRVLCHLKNVEYTVPGPAQQPDAYVDTHEWPVAMAREVIRRKGQKCQGCGKPWETLDHIVPFSRGGKTRVSNLQPMCNACNRSKGDALLYAELTRLARRPRSTLQAPKVPPSPLLNRLRARDKG